VPRRFVRPLRATKRALVDSGYLRSNWSDRPVDRSGDPTPWYTFPALAYLRGIDFSKSRVFEFGSGNSTLYWQRRAARVVSVEHDPEWHALLGPSIDASVATVDLQTNQDAYLDAVDHPDGPWDVIVVDGIRRTACARRAVGRLAVGGFIILDNADWYPEVASELREADLLEVDFHGQGPVNFYTWTTSLFFHRSAHPTPLGDQPAPPPGAIAWPHTDDIWR
jgi:hypothetical protein